MKTNRASLSARGREKGMAVIVVMILVVVILIYLAANIRTLHLLGRDLRMIEQQQTHRLAVSGQVTNSLASTNSAASSVDHK